MTVSTSMGIFTPILFVFEILLALAIPVGLVLVIVGLVQYFRPQPIEPGPEEILKRRYASGEITLSEYEELLRTIRGDQP